MSLVLSEQFKCVAFSEQASGQISRSIGIENSSLQTSLSAPLAAAASRLSPSSLQPSQAGGTADAISASRPFSHLIPKPWPGEDNAQPTQNTWSSPWPMKDETPAFGSKSTTPCSSIFAASSFNTMASQTAEIFGNPKTYSGLGGGLFGNAASSMSAAV